MAVLDLIKKVKVQTLSFEKHPCRDLDMETKIHYLNALALVANEDGKIDEKEEEYLTILINSFELSEDTLDECIEFAKNPNEFQLVEMINTFASKDIKYNLIMDAMILAQRDGIFDNAEKNLIAQYYDMFKISKKEVKDLEYIFRTLNEQDAEALSKYFNKNELIRQSMFDYIIEYYNIDLEYVLKKEEKKLLIFQWLTPSFKFGGLKNAKEIMAQPISNAKFLVYLRAMYSDNIIFIEDNKVIFNNEEKTLLMELGYSDISFKDDGFCIEYESRSDEKIMGITVNAVEDFLIWINSLKDTNYKIVEFFGDNSEDCSYIFNGEYPIDNEVYVYEDIPMIIPSSKGATYFNISRSSDAINHDLNFSFRLMR